MADIRIYPFLYRNILSHLDAERAHEWGVASMRAAQRVPGALGFLRSRISHDPRLALKRWGIDFANPLGLAAGMDKAGVAVSTLLALGFGHVEVGTVTPEPQPGNARPRIWRVSEKQALINAMGFPSEGAAVVAQRLRASSSRGVVGLNIGKNKATAKEAAVDDYVSLVGSLAGLGDYLTVNVSSPNTPGLRDLQVAGELEEIVAQVVAAEENAAKGQGHSRPVLVKLAPDLADTDLEAIAEAAVAAGAAGIVATNTTIAREGLGAGYRELPGGLSGWPLTERADHVVRLLYRSVGKRVPIVGVGGIATAADVLRRISMGASLVQIYTSFVYGGPDLPRRILNDLSLDADRRGWNHIEQLVGETA